MDTPQIDRDSELAAATVAPLTGIERGNEQVKRCPIHRIAWTNRRRSVSRFTSATFNRMSSLDPAAVRKAVEAFTPRRPQKFQDLIPAKDVIVELRQKRASYRSIADLRLRSTFPARRQQTEAVPLRSFKQHDARNACRSAPG